MSGANIGTDLWDRVYPVEPDSLYQAEGRRFAEQVLGFTRVTDQACNNGTVKAACSKELSGIPDILRYRDTMQQERVKIDDLHALIQQAVDPKVLYRKIVGK